MTDTNVIISTSKFSSIITCVVAGLVIVLIVVGYFMFKKLQDDNLQLRNEVIEFKKLTNTIARASTKWVTADDLNKSLANILTKNDLDAVKADLNSLNAKLSAVGQTVGTIKAKIAKLEASDSVGPEVKDTEGCDTSKLVDKYSYTKNPQIKLLTDINLAPLAEVQFDASKDKPWSYNIYQRDYKVSTIVAKKDDGQLVFQNKLSYVVPEKDKVKEYNIDIISSSFVQAQAKNQFYLFNPAVDLNLFVGGKVYSAASWLGNPDNLLSLGFDVGFSFMSYGENKTSSILRILRLGVGYDGERKSAHFSLAPVSFNVGKFLPPLTNLYFAPQIAFDSAGGVVVSLGVGPQF